jgi:hypothetical protein
MSEYTIPRDGQRPVRFDGDERAESLGGRWAGKDQNRYYNLTVYESHGGKFVVHWAYRTQWQGETAHDRVEDFATLEGAVEALEAFNPLDWVEGYKAIIARYGARQMAQEYVQRQAELERGIRERYRAQVAALLGDLEIVEDLEEDGVAAVYRPTAPLFDLLRDHPPAEAATLILAEAGITDAEALQQMTRVLTVLAQRAREV